VVQLDKQIQAGTNLIALGEVTPSMSKDVAGGEAVGQVSGPDVL
jgi:hypothetical protein